LLREQLVLNLELYVVLKERRKVDSEIITDDYGTHMYLLSRPTTCDSTNSASVGRRGDSLCERTQKGLDWRRLDGTGASC
jgi:hypothetical protein